MESIYNNIDKIKTALKWIEETKEPYEMNVIKPLMEKRLKELEIATNK